MRSIGNRVPWFVTPCLCFGCITSPVWEYGATADAKKAELGACSNGAIDDGEDGDNQVIDIAGRDGYWFTFVDEWGSTIQPKSEFKMAEGGREGSRFAPRMRGKMGQAGESLYGGHGLRFHQPEDPLRLVARHRDPILGEGPRQGLLQDPGREHRTRR
ncbi:MAG: hypothetical protein JW751_19835 [Polyangiaceae bacterium]|nr:hypothetical protein [Polyangiaceae bacterium]